MKRDRYEAIVLIAKELSEKINFQCSREERRGVLKGDLLAVSLLTGSDQAAKLTYVAAHGFAAMRAADTPPSGTLVKSLEETPERVEARRKMAEITFSSGPEKVWVALLQWVSGGSESVEELSEEDEFRLAARIRQIQEGDSR